MFQWRPTHIYFIFESNEKCIFSFKKIKKKNGRTFWSHLSLITNAWQFFNECVMPPWCVCSIYNSTHTYYRRENQVKCVCAGPTNAPIHEAGGHFCALLCNIFQKKEIQSLWRFFFCLFISNHFFFFWKNKGEPVCVCVWGWQPECVCVCEEKTKGGIGWDKKAVPQRLFI